jgi:hypothetical protein
MGRGTLAHLSDRVADDQLFALRIEESFERFLGELLCQKTDKIIGPLGLQMPSPLQIDLRLL